jgi:hypothetical protein
MKLVRTTMLCLAAACFLSAQNTPPAQSGPSDGVGQAEDHHKLIELLGVEWTGTRLPTPSLMRLSGLKVGQKVNYDILNEVCSKITSTGLVSAVNYAYNVQPGKPGVMVSFKLSDELPLLPASILPAANEELLWGCLQTADPIFARELPNTGNAMRFYAANIDRCLEMGSHNQEFHTKPTVACDVKGKAAKIVFNIEKREERTSRR